VSRCAGRGGCPILLVLRFDGQQAAGDSLEQSLVVAFGLVGVRAREPANRPVELVRLAPHTRRSSTHLWCEHGLWSRRPQNAHIVGKRVAAEGIEGDAALHVAELPDVVLPTSDSRPAEQRIGDSLQPLLLFDDALTLVGMPGGIAMDVAGNDRAAGLLKLQEDDVFGAAALAEHDIRAEADAAHPDDLVGDIDNGAAAEDLPPLRGQGGEVVVKRGGEPIGVLIVDAGDQRRLLDDAPPVCARLGEAWQSSVADAVPGARAEARSISASSFSSAAVARSRSSRS